MSILTLEILGKPVACIYAKDRATAEGIVQKSWLHRDLLSHQSGGEPLWDGAARLSLRQSTRGEAEIVEKRFEAHHLNDARRGADHGAVVFLVPVDAVEHDDSDEDYPV